MKSLYILPLLLVIGFVGYADAWDGQIDYEVIGGNDQTYGDILTFKVILFRADLIENEPLIITTTERETGNIVKTQTITPDSFTSGSIDNDIGWFTEYTRDTTDPVFNSDTVYDVVISYDNVSVNDNFMFNPPPADQAVASGQQFAQMEQLQTQTKPIPEWVDNIFIMYAEKQISQNELILALQYLIKVGILKV